MTINHRLGYCAHCRRSMVVCGHCSNNCCNGGSGDECPDHCASAYAYQAALGNFSVKPKRGRGQRRNRRNTTVPGGLLP